MTLLRPTILRFDSIDSTNLEAMRRARAGAAEGLCIVARAQTSGRGRLDRSWQSPQDAGLYFSIVLRPQLEMDAWPLLTLMAALAVADALLKACGLRADIKWPNDLCVNDRKLCGILAEAVETESGPAAILDGYTFPKAWYDGLIARGRGNREAAQRAFESVHATVEADLAKSPDDAKLVAMLGLVHAMRGRKDDAIAAGHRAVELLPISKDAYDGPLIAAKLAVIYAQLGETDRAMKLLEDLVTIPNGPTAGSLRVEREWDPLRTDPRFEKLANG